MKPADVAPVTSFCRHELERRQLAPRNLHDRMMLLAEPIIQHNWSDVAIHDRDKLRTIPVGHTCIWVVGKMGSYLSPMYCQLSDRKRWSADPMASAAPIQFLVIRWHSQVNLFGANKSWVANHDPTRDKHCYLVVKTSASDGEITPIRYADLANMCVYGKHQMVVGHNDAQAC